MKTNNYIILLCLTLTASIQSRDLTISESTIVGAATACTELIPGHPMSYAMNQAIKNEPFNPRHMYNGFGVSALAQAPIVAAQKVIQSQGTRLITENQNEPVSQRQQLLISYLAGIAGALIDTPSNAIQLYLQDPKNAHKTTYQAIRDLGRNSFRGFSANALLKEGPFAVGYQFMAPKLTSIAEKHIPNDTTATIAGSIGAGVITAGITQPGAIIRNRMQSGEKFSNIITNTLKVDGVRGFFKGLPQRGSRLVIAMPIYVLCASWLEKKLKGEPSPKKSIFANCEQTYSENFNAYLDSVKKFTTENSVTISVAATIAALAYTYKVYNQADYGKTKENSEDPVSNETIKSSK